MTVSFGVIRYTSLHQIPQHRVQNASVAEVIHFHIGVQQRGGFELDDLSHLP
jgi:hypothetical protein